MKKGMLIVLAVLMAALLVPQAGAVSVYIGKTAAAVSYNNACAWAAGEPASTHTFTAQKTSVSVAPDEQPAMTNGASTRGSSGSRYHPASDPASTTASTQGVAAASAKGCIAESSATSLGISAATNGIEFDI